MQLLLLSLLLPFADVSVASAPSPPADGVVSCGDRRWRALREAVDAYCSTEADRSEWLGCRVARYSFDHCDAAPNFFTDEEGTLQGGIRDPRDQSYAWLFTFAPRKGGYQLVRFVYLFDECDALGVPERPHGPLHLADLRRRAEPE